MGLFSRKKKDNNANAGEERRYKLNDILTVEELAFLAYLAEYAKVKFHGDDAAEIIKNNNVNFDDFLNTQEMAKHFLDDYKRDYDSYKEKDIADQWIDMLEEIVEKMENYKLQVFTEIMPALVELMKNQ